VYSERAFSLFLARVAQELEGGTVVVGRLRSAGGGAHYEIGDGVEFVALPWYRSLFSLAAIPALARSLAIGWRAVGSVDRVWLLGPHPLILVLGAFAVLRRKRLFLGVRQDFPAYIASRRPGSRFARAVAVFLERAFRMMARRYPTIVVGPELARNYAGSAELLEIPVSLVEADQIVDESQALAKDYSGELTILSVGRVDTEKNPLLLADVLGRLRKRRDRWRLVVCGEGPLEAELEAELARRGLAADAELAGYVPFDGGLIDRYRSAHVLLHSSWTEGLPQVLLEAFAAGLPVVASDVGGIAEALGGAVSLVAAGDPEAAAAAAERVCADPELRRELITAGLDYIRAHTLEAESARGARFLGG
jgi:glycosyltransferase involved in cell wall biosynthesis